MAHSTTTFADDWQDLCLQWAKARQEFQLLDYESDHFPFCEKLCKDYGYTLSYRVADKPFLIFKLQQS